MVRYGGMVADDEDDEVERHMISKGSTLKKGKNAKVLVSFCIAYVVL